MWARRDRGSGAVALRLAFVAGAVVGAVLAWRSTVSPRSSVFPLDLIAYFVPTYTAYFGRLAGGEWLRWNPDQLCGVPWLGTSQAGFFYPPHLLYVVLPTHLALLLSALLHFVLAAGGTAVFARGLGLGGAASIAAGVAYGLHGAMMGSIGFPYLLEGSAWLPLGCAAVHRLALGGGRRSIAGVAAVVALSWLAGSPQSTAYSLYAWGTLLVVLVLARRAGWRHAPGTVAGFALAVVLGALAAMVQLLPAWELARVGARGATALDPVAMFPFGGPRGWELWETLRPGGPAGLTLVGLALGPLALAVRGQRAIVAWAVTVGTLAFLFAHGPLSPATFALYRSLPVLPWFRVPARMLVLTGFACAMLGAVAIDAVVRAARARSRGLAVAAGAALVACSLYGVPLLPKPLPWDRDQVARTAGREAMYAALARLQGDGRVWLTPDHTPRFATAHGMRSLGDYEPLWVARQRDYLQFLVEGATGGRGTIGPHADWSRDREGLRARLGLLHLAAVRRVAVLAGVPRPIAVLGELGLQPSTEAVPGVVVFDNPRAHPRAFVTYRAERAPEGTLPYLQRLGSPAFDPLLASLVEGPPPRAADPAAPRGHPVPIVVDAPEVVEVEATLAAPGLLVLADTNAPGWHATVDGVPAPIIATNFLFRGVVVPAGTHRVRFAYASRALRAGVFASVLGWLAIVLLARPRRARAPHSM